MDTDDRIVGKIFTRRQALAAVGAAGLTLVLRNQSDAVQPVSGIDQKEIDLVATPEITEGPFFVDKDLNRSDLIAGSTRPSVKNGVPLELEFIVYDLEGKTGRPLKGALVDVWHADADGIYSDEPGSGLQSEDTRGQTWLRGHQLTDAEGKVRFKTIWPGWYPGRTVHIHMKVRVYDRSKKVTEEFTSQVFMTDAESDKVLAKEPYAARGRRRVLNANDGIYRARQADGTPVGSHLHLKISATQKGYKGVFSIAFAVD